MLARYVLAAQLAEAALYVVVAAWLRSRHGWAWPVLAALVAASPLAVRFAIVCAAFSVAWLNRSPRPPQHRLSAAASIALVLREWRALAAFNLLHLPWERRLLRPDPALRRLDRPAVVLVHGYFANRGCFVPLVRALEAAGVGPVFTPNLRSWLAPIERFGEELGAAVERIAAGTGQPVVVVAHSMGGLGARLHLANHGAARVARLITVASPHHGTALARLGVGANAMQMRMGSAFLRELERLEAGRTAHPAAISIYSLHDNLVAPQDTSRLPWARNVPLAGLGHLDILRSPRLVEALVREIGEGRGRA